MFQSFVTLCHEMSAAVEKWWEDTKKWSDMQLELQQLACDYFGKNHDPVYESRLTAIHDKYIALGLPEVEVRKVEPYIPPQYYGG